ncbi:uncharacterized protein EI90DRAFT_3127304 [Cantharellus anzutake]|uniref:uncharacterized protein n=1 Tax=Cantharellus anzutake TaxID=1750568 RepID=UPI00190644EA|nr:uncharacterized protein EI90DRAFT_3127304 [Cantharellus anzutake]KAF8327245.1 hypothetical protein EI90DRAFT_3127304 [Cantharellus anzutake]
MSKWLPLWSIIMGEAISLTSLGEEHGGLDVDQPNHLWLLHKLFLNALNAHIGQFVQSWNHHIISIRGEWGQSPIDMFGFDMLVHGIRGNMVWEEDMVRVESNTTDTERLQDDVLHPEDLTAYDGDIQDEALQAPGSWRRHRLHEVIVSVDHDNLSSQIEAGLISFISPHLEVASTKEEMLGVWQIALAAMRNNFVPGF